MCAYFFGFFLLLFLQVEDLPKLKSTVENYLDDYNTMATLQMPLVMFLDACEHVARYVFFILEGQKNALYKGWNFYCVLWRNLSRDLFSCEGVMK